METIDWLVVGGYCLLITLVGLAFKDRAEGGVEDFFVSGRKLPWWLAGTSLVATSFASDTPLFVTGLVRKHGIAGNWHWWFVVLGSVASLFMFARLWRRARVVTDMEFIELRYGSGAGAALRGCKAIFLGVVFNVYALGAWPVLGLTKVLEETTSWSKVAAVLFCSVLALTYAAFSGLWGVVATDFIQFLLALGGGLVLAAYALGAVGGFEGLTTQLAGRPELSFFPEHSADSFWDSPLVFLLSLVLVQWWARGVEGDGIAVQRLSACKDEKNSFFAMLWFNVAHYALRAWPWIVVSLASLVLLPEVLDAAGAVDHERAYPRLIVSLVPAGLRGLLVASFFAAFMSTVDTHLNWGASYVVNDVYKRFVRKKADKAHYLRVARVVTVVLMIGGAVIALGTSSIVDAFYNVLLLFSGVGLAGVARWLWWRVNAWTELSAMVASGVLTLAAGPLCRLLDWPDARPIHLLIVVVGSTLVWTVVTLLSPPASAEQLQEFYKRVRPPGPGWNAIRAAIGDDAPEPEDGLGSILVGWLTGSMMVIGLTIAIGKILLGNWPHALLAMILAAVGLCGVTATIRRMRWS